jgi:gluconate 2-dehydrogenase gamma chain
MKATSAIGASMLPVALAPDAATAQEHQERRASPTHCPADPTTAPGTSAQSQTYLFLNDEEAAFIEAAVARLIPKDEQWAGALEAGVPNYIDKQLAGS